MFYFYGGDVNKIALNDLILSAASPVIHCNDRGFLLGDGLFETIKAQQGNLLFFKRHYDRLAASAEELSIPLTINQKTLNKRCYQLLEINGLLSGQAAIRITLTRGKSARGLSIQPKAAPTLLITAAAYSMAKDKAAVAYITNIKRNEYSPFSTLKTLNYLEQILARHQALAHGYTEGIMLNTQGAITETSVGNLFAVIDHQIVTPKISDGVLPGIIRATIIQTAKKKGTPIIERTLYPADILTATELFHTNSLIEVQSFAKVNNHSLRQNDLAASTQQTLNQLAD